MSRSNPGQNQQHNWANHPLVVAFGIICPVIALIFTILAFINSGEKKQNPTSLNKGFFVIGFADQDKNKVINESTRQKESGFENQVTYSSDWSELEPGWYIVVYGFYETRSEAEIRQEFLERKKINTYIKYSGYNAATFGSR